MDWESQIRSICKKLPVDDDKIVELVTGLLIDQLEGHIDDIDRILIKKLDDMKARKANIAEYIVYGHDLVLLGEKLKEDWHVIKRRK